MSFLLLHINYTRNILKLIKILVRFVLATLVAFSWESFRKTIDSIFGKQVAFWFTAITLSQFHFIFYMSRTLPNILVLPTGMYSKLIFLIYFFQLSISVLLSITAWLKQENKKFIWLSGLSIIIFRSELILFFGLLLLYNLYYKKLHFKK